MARATKTSPAAASDEVTPTYEPETTYRVTLNRVVLDSPVGILSPAHQNELQGWVCEAIKDAITHAEPV